MKLRRKGRGHGYYRQMQDEITQGQAVAQHGELTHELAIAKEILADDPYNKVQKRYVAQLRAKVQAVVKMLLEKFKYDTKEHGLGRYVRRRPSKS